MGEVSSGLVLGSQKKNKFDWSRAPLNHVECLRFSLEQKVEHLAGQGIILAVRTKALISVSNPKLPKHSKPKSHTSDFAPGPTPPAFPAVDSLVQMG